MKRTSMKKKSLAVVVIVMMILIAVLAGCNKTDGQSGSGTSGEVALKMYLLGDRTKDFDLVYAEINKVLKEKINATISVDFLSWAEHDQRYSLLFAGGEDFDLIFTASGWGHYEPTVALGGLYPLSETFIRTNAPETWNTVPAMAWEQAKIDGQIYMVPNCDNEFQTDVYAIRGDLMSKYGYNDITSLQQLTEFFGKVAAGESGVFPRGNSAGGMLYDYFQDSGYYVMNGSRSELFIYNNQNPSDTKITYLLDWDRFDQYCRDMQNYYNQGFWSRDSLASTDQRQDGLLRGTAAGMAWNLGSTSRYAAEANASHPDWAVTVVDYAQKWPKRVASYINNGVAINAASKNKERAMQALNEFYTNKTVFDLSTYGIPGVHWNPEGDKSYSQTARTGDYGINANCNWGWKNVNLLRTEFIPNPTPLDNKQAEILARWNNNVKPIHPLDGFVFDTANVNTELAIVDSLIAEFYTPLISGMAGDAATALANLRRQLDQAGIARVIAEVNSQAQAFLARR